MSPHLRSIAHIRVYARSLTRREELTMYIVVPAHLCGVHLEAKSPGVPFSDFSGPKGELCFWVRHPKQVTFRNMVSQEKVVQQQTKAPLRGATAEQMESLRQDAQRGHSEILAGVDSSRGDDVRALLGASSNASRAAGASAFDHDLGLRGTVADLIPDESAA